MKNKIMHCCDSKFEDFVKSNLLYHKVIKVTKVSDQVAELELDNGIILVTRGNEGCGGCGNGWFYLEDLNICDNAITNIEIAHNCEGEYGEEVFTIFVYADNVKINLLSYSGGDNGYYGVGYTLSVKRKNYNKDK